MTANENTDRFSLLKKVPHVLRARGFRLYTQGGLVYHGKRRLIDLWQNGGAAVLGHTPANMLRELKNTASRGLYAPFPHFTERRYLKALSKLFPGHSFRLYAAPPDELVKTDSVNSFLEKTSHGGTAAQRYGEEGAGSGVALWRPFNNAEEPFAVKDGSSLFIAVLPGIQTWRIQDDVILPMGLCVVAAKNENLLEHLPPGDNLSPVLLAAAARGIYDLLAAPQRAKPALPRVFKTLQNSPWKHSGIYLNLKEEPKDNQWAALFKKFLDAGFLLPPTPLQPVILPGELSAGEDAKLAAVLGTLS
jgi:hypothetical protein